MNWSLMFFPDLLGWPAITEDEVNGLVPKNQDLNDPAELPMVFAIAPSVCFRLIHLT